MMSAAKEYPKLAKQLRELAEDYFNDEPIDHLSGICSALVRREADAYHAIDTVMEELGFKTAYFGTCSQLREKWEPRAYMCLFLAEYLEGSK